MKWGFNCIKIAFFSKQLLKIAQRLVASPYNPIASGGWGLRLQTPICDPFKLHYFAQHVSQFRRFNFGFKPSSFSKILVKKVRNQATASDLSFYDILSLFTKRLLFELFCIACSLWFAPPPPSSKNPGNAGPLPAQLKCHQ